MDCVQEFGSRTFSLRLAIWSLRLLVFGGGFVRRRPLWRSQSSAAELLDAPAVMFPFIECLPCTYQLMHMVCDQEFGGRTFSLRLAVWSSWPPVFAVVLLRAGICCEMSQSSAAELLQGCASLCLLGASGFLESMTSKSSAAELLKCCCRFVIRVFACWRFCVGILEGRIG
jgi:hypothetical protein